MSRLLFVAIVPGYLQVASWLVRSSLDRAVRVRALAVGTSCCFLGQDTLTSQCLSRYV